MKRMLIAIIAVAAMLIVSAAGSVEKKQENTGEELFKEHCSACHLDGGNIINPQKTLRKAEREAHGIVGKADIIEKMRHPGKGMTSWSAATISDQDAEAIADFILSTFK